MSSLGPNPGRAVPAIPAVTAGDRRHIVARGDDVASRSTVAAGTLNAVSFMPSGSKMRSHRNASSDRPVRDAISSPRMSEPL